MLLKKKMTLVLAAILTLGALSACGDTNGTTGGTTSPPDAKAEEIESEKNTDSQDTKSAEVDTKEADGKKTVVTVMLSGTATEKDFHLEIMPPIIEEQFPQVTFEVTKLPDDQYYTALKTKLASGESADMLGVQPKWAGANSTMALAKAGYLAPITELDCLKLSSDSAKEGFTYEGEVYAIPNSVSILGTYYNIDIFEENNLEVPTTWDEFINVCAVLKDAGIQPIVMGDKDMYVMQFGLYQIAASKIYPNNPKFDDQLYTGETNFTDSDTWDTVLSMYQELYDNGYIDSSSLGLSAQQAIQRFIDGEAAITFDGNFNAPALQAKGKVEFERGYFPLPGNDENEEIYASMAPGGSLAIYSGSSNIDICKEILNFWNDGESELWKAMVDSGGTIVAYGYGADQVDPLFMPFMDMYNAGKAYYWCNQAWPAGVENEMQAKLSELIGGQGTTVSDITNAMQMKFEELSDS